MLPAPAARNTAALNKCTAPVRAPCRGGPNRFPGRLADARLPAHLRLARPQFMSEWAELRLVVEQRNGHPYDHARAGRGTSMITGVGSEPGPGGVGPGAGIRAGCADRSGGQGEHRMGLGYGGPDARAGLAASLAEQSVRLSGKRPVGGHFGGQAPAIQPYRATRRSCSSRPTELAWSAREGQPGGCRTPQLGEPGVTRWSQIRRPPCRASRSR